MTDRTPLQRKIDAFLAGSPFAVVGASTNRAKYGNKVLRVYQQAGLAVHPINPRAESIEGLRAYPDLTTLVAAVGPIHGLSIITPPAITEAVMREAAELRAAGVNIPGAWMQPGAQSAQAVRIGEAAGMSVIGGDACVLVVLGFRGST